MSNRLSALAPLGYTGTNAAAPPNVFVINRKPNSQDYQNYTIGDIWVYIDKSVNPYNTEIYMLTSLYGNRAIWSLVTGGEEGIIVVDITTNDATPTALYSFPISAGNMVSLYGNVTAQRSDGSAGLTCCFNGGARRPGANAVLVGVPDMNVSTDNPDADVNLIVNGENLVLQVTGIAAQTWTWQFRGEFSIID